MLLTSKMSCFFKGFSNANPEPVSVLVDINQAQFVLCTLQPGKIPQQQLSLNFTEGEEVSFSIEGDGEVHLTGQFLFYLKEVNTQFDVSKIVLNSYSMNFINTLKSI